MINITKKFHFEIAILSVKRKFCTNNSITVTPTTKTDLYIVQKVIVYMDLRNCKSCLFNCDYNLCVYFFSPYVQIHIIINSC